MSNDSEILEVAAIFALLNRYTTETTYLTTTEYTIEVYELSEIDSQEEIAFLAGLGFLGSNNTSFTYYH